MVERGYAVSEVAQRLGISTKSLYTWKAQFSKPVRAREAEADLVAELRKVKKELARATEERDILKKAAAYFARVDLSRFSAAPSSHLSGNSFESQALPDSGL